MTTTNRMLVKRVRFHAGRALEYGPNVYRLSVYWDPDPDPRLGQRMHRRWVELRFANPFHGLSYSLWPK